MAIHLRRGLLLAAVIFAGLGLAWRRHVACLAAAGEPGGGKAAATATPAATAATPAAAEEEDPLGANAACYVCHVTFVKEDLAGVHLKAKIGCIDCHGLSAKHANDEDIGATKPDITFKRPQIDASCVKCHESHNARVKDVIARLLDRHLSPKTTPTCTECHGTHKIDRSATESPAPSGNKPG